MKKKSYSKTNSNNENIKIMYGTCIKDLDKQIEAFTEKIISVTYYVSETYMAVIKYQK